MGLLERLRARTDLIPVDLSDALEAEEVVVRHDLRTTDDALVIGFDPGLLDPRSSGRIDVTCRIPEPERALEWIRAEQRAGRRPPEGPRPNG